MKEERKEMESEKGKGKRKKIAKRKDSGASKAKKSKKTTEAKPEEDKQRQPRNYNCQPAPPEGLRKWEDDTRVLDQCSFEDAIELSKIVIDDESSVTGIDWDRISKTAKEKGLEWDVEQCQAVWRVIWLGRLPAPLTDQDAKSFWEQFEKEEFGKLWSSDILETWFPESDGRGKKGPAAFLEKVTLLRQIRLREEEQLEQVEQLRQQQHLEQKQDTPFNPLSLLTQVSPQLSPSTGSDTLGGLDIAALQGNVLQSLSPTPGMPLGDGSENPFLSQFAAAAMRALLSKQSDASIPQGVVESLANVNKEPSEQAQAKQEEKVESVQLESKEKAASKKAEESNEVQKSGSTSIVEYQNDPGFVYWVRMHRKKEIDQVLEDVGKMKEGIVDPEELAKKDAEIEEIVRKFNQELEQEWKSLSSVEQQTCRIQSLAS